MTSDHLVHVTRSPHVVHDNVTGQMTIQLFCGNFTFKDQPPFSVEWLTPSGQVHTDSAFKNGQFQFLTPSPVESGLYVCRIPQRFSGLHCLPSNLSLVGQAAINVDGLEVRVAMLEVQQSSLKHENLLLKQENEGLTGRLMALENASSSARNDKTVEQLAEVVSNQTQKVDNLTQIVHSQTKDVQNLTDLVDNLHEGRQGDTRLLTTLQQELTEVNTSAQHASVSSTALAKEIHMLEVIHINDNTSVSNALASIKQQLSRNFNALPTTDFKRVSFHAQLASNMALGSGHTLVLANVFNNHGDAYDNTTGIFTAPFDGTYFFIASTGSHNQSHDAYVEMVADDVPVALAYAHRSEHSSEMATCHAVVDLTSGQQVWLKSMLDSYFNYADTFFTGFLVGHD